MRLRLLTDEQIQQIHEASIRILDTIDVHVPHEETLNLFSEAGAFVNHETQWVEIPEKVVRHCLEIAGKQFTIFGRDRNLKARFGVGERNYNTIAGEAHWVDDEWVYDIRGKGLRKVFFVDILEFYQPENREKNTCEHSPTGDGG